MFQYGFRLSSKQAVQLKEMKKQQISTDRLNCQVLVPGQKKNTQNIDVY